MISEASSTVLSLEEFQVRCQIDQQANENNKNVGRPFKENQISLIGYQQCFVKIFLKHIGQHESQNHARNGIFSFTHAISQ